MIGEDYFYKEEKPLGTTGELLLNVQNLSVKNDSEIETVKDVSFSIAGGEMLGLAGIEGSGQTELIEALTFVREIENGKLTFGGKSLDKITIANIPANRQKEGIVKDFSIANNIILGRQREKNFSYSFLLKERQIKNYTAELINKFDIRPVDTEQKIRELSGGNQQKVVTARELSKNTEFIIASHPTRGLDIKASHFVHSRLLEAKKEGKAILLVSSDLNELLKLSDRIAVMYKGKIAAVLDAEKTNEREIGLYMTGAKEKL